MSKRKEITNEYKSRRGHGGVYRVVNTLHGRYLIGHVVDLKSIQNRFQFALSTGLVFHSRLQKDWEEQGAQAFRLDILEELEQKPEQSQAEFIEELKILEQLSRAEFDPEKAY